MNIDLEKFDDIINSRLEKTKQLLLMKGKEYIRGNDRFHNFNRTADMNREKPTRSLHGMLSKHLVSILDMLDDIDADKLPTEALVDEKFGDAIVYFMLQEAQIKHMVAISKQNQICKQYEQTFEEEIMSGRMKPSL